jgi:glycosyltransferase involved in cell wall biosynthesis
VGVLPFPDEEKFQVSSPVKLFEYMAAGLSILATRIVCHTDVAGEDAFTFWADESTPESFYTTLECVQKNRAQLPVMGQRAAEAAEAYTWHASAMRLKDALEKGLERSG